MSKQGLNTVQDIKILITDNNDVVTLQMDDLKGIVNAGKLGVNVLKRISDSLRSEGIGHVPVDLPQYQHNNVKLYIINSGVGSLITAVLNATEKNDEYLREAVKRVNEDDLQKVLDFVNSLKNNKKH